LRKNDTISITDGKIAQSGKVINITVSNPKHIKVALLPLFTELKLSDLSWRLPRQPQNRIRRRQSDKLQRQTEAHREKTGIEIVQAHHQ
jgi:hypothetical protein